MSFTVQKVHSREVIDSRGNPTVEAEVTLTTGAFGTAIVPPGASTGEHEAIELRDKNPDRFLGKGVTQAVKNVNKVIAPEILGKEFSTLSDFDQTLIKLDSTFNKSRLGANSLLSLSLAVAHANAQGAKQPLYQWLHKNTELKQCEMSLPVPMMNVINGGEHADNGLAFQEFMIVPHGFDSFKECLRAGCEVSHHLKKLLHSQNLSTNVGDEGGFAPNLTSHSQTLTLLIEAIKQAGYEPQKNISIALDVASSEFYERDQYHMEGKSLSASEMSEYYQSLMSEFPIISIEDALDENDWEGWHSLTQKIGNQTQLVGDDLFVTNPKFLAKGIEKGCGNAILVKINQIGTLTETIKTLILAKNNNYKAVVSHRSGETEDTSISHLAVASGCGQIKTGSLSRTDRTAKYNELLRIEDRDSSLNFRN